MRRLSIEHCHDTAKKRGGQCLETEYIGATTPMRWRCGQCDTVFTNRYGNVKHGQWCPKCRYGVIGQKQKILIRVAYTVKDLRNYIEHEYKKWSSIKIKDDMRKIKEKRNGNKLDE